MTSFRDGKRLQQAVIGAIEEMERQEAEFVESLKNIELIRPLLKTLNTKFGYTQDRGRAPNALDGSSYNARANRPLSAIGANSETKLLGGAKAPPLPEKGAQWSPDSPSEKFLAEMTKIAMGSAKKKNKNGHEPFSLVFRADGETLGMLWNTELSIGGKSGVKTDLDGLEGNIEVKAGFSVKSSWTYARTDAMWTTTKTVRQRQYGAKNNWDKWKHVQVPTTLATKSDIVGNVVYEISQAHAGKTIEIYGIYPDTESFALAASRQEAKKGTSEREQAHSLRSGLAGDAVDRIFKDKVDKAVENFKGNVARVADTVSKKVVNGERDRQAWNSIESMLLGLKDRAALLRQLIDAVNDRKKSLQNKHTSPGASDYLRSERNTDEAIDDMLARLGVHSP